MQGRTLLRLGLVVLPAALLFSSLAALLMSIPAWGAGNHAGLPAWMPTAAAIVVGLPGGVIAVLCLNAILRATRVAFSLTPLVLTFGLFAMPVAIATDAAVAIGVADAGTYDRLLEPEQNQTLQAFVDAPTSDRPFSPAGFMAGTVIIALLLNGVVAISAVTYVSAVNIDSGKRFEKRPDEYDAIAEMLMGHRGPGAPFL